MSLLQIRNWPVLLHRCMADTSFSLNRWNSFLCENSVSHFEIMMSNQKVDSCQSMHIFARNVSAKFHPHPIWNNGALKWKSLLKTIAPVTMTSSDKRSVPDLKVILCQSECAYCAIKLLLMCFRRRLVLRLMRKLALLCPICDKHLS